MPGFRVLLLCAVLAAIGLNGYAAEIYSHVGGASCATATVLPVTVGPAGQPNEVLIHGTNVEATGTDCSFFGSDPIWWEAFRLEQCANVQFDLCQTEPIHRPSYLVLFDECPCRTPVTRDAGDRGEPGCSNMNVWMRFDALPAGTYYYPVYSNEDYLINGRGPYTIRILAEACTGACCDEDTGSCTDGLGEDACLGPAQRFAVGVSCCEAECRGTGEEFDVRDTELLNRVGFDAFDPRPRQAADVWGYVSPSGREYAIIGFSTGTGIVEVTRPREPVVVSFIGSGGIDIIWREMKTLGHFLYVVSDVLGVGLQIIDLSRIDDGLATLVNTTTLGDVFVTAHNIAINTESGFAYLAMANAPSRGITALDLSDPLNPTIAGTWNDSQVHDLQVVSYNRGSVDEREIAFVYAGGDGFFVVDVTDKQAMKTIGGLLYPTVGYSHQGWLSSDRRHVFMDDEFDERNGNVNTTTTYVINVEDLTAPTLATTFTNGLCAIDHNLMTRGSLVYEANYTSGLRIFDASDLNDIHEVGHLDTYPESNEQAFDGAWGVFAGFPSGIVAVSDIQRGLFLAAHDCDDNGVSDVHELDMGPSVDCNANRFLDVCEFLVRGDLDRDRAVRQSDLPLLTECLSAPCAWHLCEKSSYPQACCRHTDFNSDGDVDLEDTATWLNRLTRP